MRKNGFTLIELLAVIVILAIIALIATPIILVIINDAREKANERSVELYASAVRNGIAAHQLRTGNEVLPGTYNETNKLPFDVEYDGKVDCTSVIIGEDGKVSLDKCTVNGGTKEYSYGTKQSDESDEVETPDTVVKICTIDRKDASKYSVGDIVTCELSESTDMFYVIEDASLDTSIIQMLTENRIDASTYRQNAYASSEPFTDSSYWSNETTYPVDVYDKGNNRHKIVVEHYLDYLNEKLTGTTGRLLTYSQAKNLGCLGIDESCENAPEWLYSTTYRLGTAYDKYNVLIIGSGGSLCYDGAFNGNDAGVRPVITISTSDIQ